MRTIIDDDDFKVDLIKGLPDKFTSKTTTSLKWKVDFIDYFRDDKYKDMKILEIGSSLGHSSRTLSFLFKKVIAVDNLSERHIKSNRLNYDRDNIEFWGVNMRLQPLQAIFYDKLNLPVLKKTPGGKPSTAEPVLVDLAQDYELPATILQYRSLAKLKSTYTDKLPLDINAATGRIHTSYHQAVAATGRLSSSDPNLQNIPIRNAEGRRIRQAFVAPAGKVVMASDYSRPSVWSWTMGGIPIFQLSRLMASFSWRQSTRPLLTR